MSKIIRLNKPFNVLSQFTDTEDRPTLSDYIHDKSVYPAGRLDYDSEGLLLLTDDGRIQHQIAHPKAKMEKTYWVQVEGSPTDSALEPLRLGITLKDGPCRPAKAKIIEAPEIWPRTPPIRQRDNIPTSWLEIRISEGRNRQVRRMTATIGYPTLRLIRVRIGPWSLGSLQPGESVSETIHSSQPSSPKTRKAGKNSKSARSRHSNRRPS